MCCLGVGGGVWVLVIFTVQQLPSDATQAEMLTDQLMFSSFVHATLIMFTHVLPLIEPSL